MPTITTSLGRGVGRSAKRAPRLAWSAVDLGLDVERLLAARDAAVVARDHELTDLLPQRAVGGRRAAARQRRDLRVDVERLLAAHHAARRLRLDELPDLRVGLGPRRRAARLGRTAALVAVERERALADPLV